ncbi:S8 family serine peptidase [Micromonospora sp. NPDC003197]
MLAAGLVLGTGPAGWAKPAAPTVVPPGAGVPAGPFAGTARPGTGTVTLLTGDRVTLTSSGASTVQPAKGREHVKFFVDRDGDAVHVIPQDAQRLIRDGKLDRRLFDVRGLLRHGYHDAARDSLPLIVTYRVGAAQAAGATFTAAGAKRGRDLPAVGGAAVTVGKGATTRFWGAVTTGSAAVRTDTAGGIDRIWLDGKRQVSLEHSVPQIGAPVAHAAGFTGRGVTVAVLDTGIDDQHSDLAGKVAEARNFSDAPDVRDEVGHGTHVASTIAGSGAASGGKYRGVAPDAALLSGKVCESTYCTDSAILAGMQWAAAEKKATLVNLSLGGMDTPDIDPLEEAVNTLTAQTGTLFVIAAGNDGGEGTVGSPGSADAALTVGAVDRDDQLADFSSRGPRVGDDAIKPDLTAPGVEIVAARATGTEMGTPVGDGYVAASGTSMATPHVVGAAALLAQQHPTWKAEQLKSTLVASAKPNPALTAFEQGAGRVDVARAITQSVTSSPVGLSYGRTAWPHDDDEPVARTVTYRNTGSTAVTLQLSTQVNGPGGAAAPAGMFQVGAAQVTVPAGGQAEVTVTADTSVASPDGHYTGRLLATAGSTVVNTPLAVNKEPESYNLTLQHIDAAGNASTGYRTYVVGLDEYRFEMPYTASGTTTIRLPKGRYGLSSWLDTPQGDEYDLAVIAQPELALTRDTTITLDARLAKPIEVSVPEPTAALALGTVGYAFSTPFWVGNFSVLTDDFATVTVGQLGRAVPSSQFASSVTSQWARPDGSGWFQDSPYLYSVSEAIPGRLPNGFVRHYRQRDLATVRHEFRGTLLPGQWADRLVLPVHDGNLGMWTAVLRVPVPGQRVEYHNTKGVRWISELQMYRQGDDGWPVPESGLVSAPTAYRAGQHYQQRWNGAPYGLSFPGWAETGIVRQGDNMLVNLPMFGDSAGHPGGSPTTAARTALYRNGTLVGELGEPGYGWFEVPPERANYRVETSATRTVSELSTRVEATWTFKSGHVPGDDFVPVPAMVVRYAPRLDVANSAPAGRSFDIPVTVAHQPGSQAGSVRSLAVEVSYDDGKTWQKAKLRSSGKGWVASVRHPGQPGYVSLRAKAVDSAGNTVKQSVIRAYKLI